MHKLDPIVKLQARAHGEDTVAVQRHDVHRMQSVKAGFDFHQHFVRTRDQRLKRVASPENTLQQYNADPDFVHAMVRPPPVED